MDKVVGKSHLSTVDLAAYRRGAFQGPRWIRAYEVAAELGAVAPSALSDFERGKRSALPDGRGASEYRAAVDRIAERREIEARKSAEVAA